MKFFQRLELWGDNHHPKWLDYIRIALGLFLCYKGISFLFNMSYLMSLMSKANMGLGSFVIIMFGQFLIIVTLASGILLVLGLHTRIVCLVQMPILVAAVFLLNLRNSGAVNSGEVLLTVLTLALLSGFLFIGDGPLSYDKLFHEEDKTYRTEHDQQR